MSENMSERDVLFTIIDYLLVLDDIDNAIWYDRTLYDERDKLLAELRGMRSEVDV